MKKLRLLLAQINPTVGDLSGNAALIKAGVEQARRQKVDIVLFPELAITGYPPEDLLLKPHFLKQSRTALRHLAKATRGLTAIVGGVDPRPGGLFNAAGIFQNGRLTGMYHKMRLPNYGVFDEQRYFQPGTKLRVIDVNGWKVGITICEDIWDRQGPLHVLKAAGADVIVVINGSPYHAAKWKERYRLIRHWAQRTGAFVAYVNLVGGQDELVFDGHSMVVSPGGKLIAMAPGFEESLLVVDLPKPAARLPKPLSIEDEIYKALVLGTRDYVRKNGFSHVVIGLSGGIDSALVAAIAADAIGPENVTGVFMPSPYSSSESREDAEAVARTLGIERRDIPITPIMKSFEKVLADSFTGRIPDITEENLQARIRGNIVMALSNKFGWLVLTTGNKSEMSTGYATLYGDMAGGFAVIKDVPKTIVYKLCRYRNRRNKKPVFPERVLTKAPTAELRPGQKDTDSLPPYPLLDAILKEYVEEDRSAAELLRNKKYKNAAAKVIGLVDRSEYKRRQAPPGIKITPKSFGRDRRMPITNRYLDKTTHRD